MKIEFKDCDGYMIIDDNTGRILSVLYMKDGKSDARTFYSYSNKGDKHYKLDISKL